MLVARESGVLARLKTETQAKGWFDKLPKYAQKHISAAKLFADRQAQQVRFEAKMLCELVGDVAKQQFAFLKGSAYVLSDSPVSQGRTFSDIDFLVSKTELNQVEHKLMLYGWFQDETSDYDQRYYRRWTHEIPPLRHNIRGTVLDLHHNILPPVSGRAPDMVSFWQTLKTLDSGAKVFSPAALSLHSLVHLFFQEEFSHGFRDLSDLNILFTHHGQEAGYWKELIDLAQACGFEFELFLACRYTNRVFNTVIPEQVATRLARLEPNPLRLRLLDWVFSKVLMPQHSLVNPPMTGLAHTVALFRGHWLKMPLHILIYHTLSKGLNSLNYLFTGREAKHGKGANEGQQEQ